ncbi:ion channel [Pseudomonas sp. NY15437]|uniref:ion channel n=1 Tax=Pseudomonas sp. NY15437 TaxID=3400360 RepID=UPI003A8800F1
MAKLPRIQEKVEISVDVRDIDSPKKPRISQEVKLIRVSSAYNQGQKLHKIKNTKFTKCLFSGQEISEVNFYNCTFQNCILNGAEFNECEFHGCKFVNCSFFKASFSNSYLDPRSFKFDATWRRHYANVNVWLFQELYRNAKNMHQETFAMYADIDFQFYRRYEYLFGREKKPGMFIVSLLYDLVLGYGYGIWNAAISTVLGVSLFTFLIRDHIADDGDVGVAKALYFSVVSLTTVGYGDVLPQKDDFALILTMLFLLGSVVWLAIVTAIVVKRMVK